MKSTKFGDVPIGKSQRYHNILYPETDFLWFFVDGTCNYLLGFAIMFNKTEIDQKIPLSEAAELLGVSVASAVRWLQRWHDIGSAEPKPRGGSVSPLERHAEQILALIAEQSDLTLEETIAELRKRRIRTSKSAALLRVTLLSPSGRR